MGVARGVDRQGRAAARIQRQLAAVRDPRAREMHANAGKQFIDHDRLADIINGTGFERPHHVVGIGQAGHEDDRQVLK